MKAAHKRSAAAMLAIALASCAPEPGGPDISPPAAVRSMELEFLASSGERWRVELALREDLSAQSMTITCDGALYNGGPVATTEVIGARLRVVDGANCEQGNIEVYLFTADNLLSIDDVGRFRSTGYYFFSGEFVGRSDMPLDGN